MSSRNFNITQDSLRAELHEVSHDATRLIEGLDEAQLARRPQPNKWSIAENLEHLSVTTRAFLPFAEHAIAVTREKRAHSRGPFQLGLYGKALARYVEPPPLIKLPAPKQLRPLPIVSIASVFPRFMELQDAMEMQMNDAEGLDLQFKRFPSPLASYVRMNLLEFFCVFNGHSRRHTWQADQVKRLL
jgi:hypothetical protein